MSKRIRRRFTEQFRASAAAMVLVEGQPVSRVCTNLDRVDSVLRRWIDEAKGVTAPGKPVSAQPITLTAEQAELQQLRRENQILRMEREILKKSDGVLRQAIDMTFRFVQAQSAMYPILLLCRVLEVSRAGYYAWRQRQARPSAHRQRDAVLQTILRKLHADGRSVYGSPRLTKAAKAAGIAIGRHAIARLMRREGLVGRCWSRRPRSAPAPASTPVIPNRLMRSFNQLTPNRVWVADITYLPAKHGTLYLAVVLDLYSRRVVGHAIANHMRTELPLAALYMALGQRGPVPGLLHHSDQGSQYTSHLYQDELKKLTSQIALQSTRSR